MLPQFFKILCVNNSGQTITFSSNGVLNLKLTWWYIAPATGKIEYSQATDDDMDFDAGRSITDGTGLMDDSSLVATVEFDNTGNKYIGAQVQLEVTHDEGTAADGTFDLYLDGGDASGELASDQTGFGDADDNKLEHIGSLTWDPNGTDDQVMSSPVFNI